jgi:succinate dehydrogenase/fumarate reductase flavoprotein subunit
MPDVVVAGAGMAGLVAAVEATERGADVLLLEKAEAVGGSMRLSSGVVWRYRDLQRFREECPGGDPALQRVVHEALDRDIVWLERLGVRVLEHSTGNPETRGVRFSVPSLVRALASRVRNLRLHEPLRELPVGAPVILATGGFQAERGLVRTHITPEADALLLRATPWSTGDGLRLGLEAGAAASAGMDEFYGRNMPARPARVRPVQFVELAQLYAHHATVVNAAGERYEPQSWSEIDVVQWTARQPGARATYRVPRDRLSTRVRERTVGTMIEAAERAGAVVTRNSTVEIEVVAGITTTLGGLKVDSTARAADGVFAAGCDVGGISTGGYSSGLAAALVLGRRAAAAALEEA